MYMLFLLYINSVQHISSLCARHCSRCWGDSVQKKLKSLSLWKEFIEIIPKLYFCHRALYQLNETQNITIIM